MRRRRQRVPGGQFGSGNARHGLSANIIEAMRVRQDDRCFVCGEQLLGVPQVEHDHALAALHGHEVSRGCSRCVRGLSCAPCNSILGFARDDPAILRRAANVLEEWRRRHPLS